MSSNEWPYVIAAYAVTWVVLAGYALYLRATVRRAARMRETVGSPQGGPAGHRTHGRAA